MTPPPSRAPRALELSGPVEDYLKAIYELERSGEAAETNAIARLLGIAPASVSGMVRRLVDYGLITHERYRGVRRGRRPSGGAHRRVRGLAEPSVSPLLVRPDDGAGDRR